MDPCVSIVGFSQIEDVGDESMLVDALDRGSAVGSGDHAAEPGGPWPRTWSGRAIALQACRQNPETGHSTDEQRPSMRDGKRCERYRLAVGLVCARNGAARSSSAPKPMCGTVEPEIASLHDQRAELYQ
jgi:hypothetical protein